MPRFPKSFIAGIHSFILFNSWETCKSITSSLATGLRGVSGLGFFFLILAIFFICLLVSHGSRNSDIGGDSGIIIDDLVTNAEEKSNIENEP